VSTTLLDILGPQGSIARRLADRYEHRPQQMEMATAVERAFTEGHHLLVEAGTGVGKSFAYLLPAIDFAVRNKKRVVISTHAISLQEQLIDKDIPLLRSIYPDEFTAVLVKGRSNYLCQRRLEQARGRQNFLFDEQRQLDSLWAIEEWATQTTDGSLADLPAIPDRDVWDTATAWARSARTTTSASGRPPSGACRVGTSSSSTTRCSSATWRCGWPA
jgi:ATP-dependent DNA helicase DinG